MIVEFSEHLYYLSLPLIDNWSRPFAFRSRGRRLWLIIFRITFCSLLRLTLLLEYLFLFLCTRRKRRPRYAIWLKLYELIQEGLALTT